MISIRFADTDNERRGLGFLAGRFAFTSRSNGQTLVPETALAALAREAIRFNVEGPATYEQLVPALRNSPAATV